MALYDLQLVSDDVRAWATSRQVLRARSACGHAAAQQHPAVAEDALKTCEEIDRLESDADRS